MPHSAIREVAEEVRDENLKLRNCLPYHIVTTRVCCQFARYCNIALGLKKRKKGEKEIYETHGIEGR
jgi:hypothetical protein